MSAKSYANGRGMGGHHLPNEGVTDTWLTPPEILKALGEFDTDPACPPLMPWRTARLMYTESDNGLMMPWEGRVWLNPPYGRETGVWLEQLAMHGNGIALVFARTETEMFHRQVWERAAGIFFLEGRINFYRADGIRSDRNAGAPSVLVAYGRSNVEALRVCGLKGRLVDLRLSQEVFDFNEAAS